MTTSTPISPPALSTNAPPPVRTSDAISPVSRSGTFTHKTSPAVTTQTPLIDTSTPAINDTPVELDSTPAMNLQRRTPEGVISPADEEDIDAEFLAEGESAGRGVIEKREKEREERRRDLGVIVDVPREPTAEEVEAVKRG